MSGATTNPFLQGIYKSYQATQHKDTTVQRPNLGDFTPQQLNKKETASDNKGFIESKNDKSSFQTHTSRGSGVSSDPNQPSFMGEIQSTNSSLFNIADSSSFKQQSDEIKPFRYSNFPNQGDPELCGRTTQDSQVTEHLPFRGPSHFNQHRVIAPHSDIFERTGFLKIVQKDEKPPLQLF